MLWKYLAKRSNNTGNEETRIFTLRDLDREWHEIEGKSGKLQETWDSLSSKAQEIADLDEGAGNTFSSKIYWRFFTLIPSDRYHEIKPRDEMPRCIANGVTNDQQREAAEQWRRNVLMNDHQLGVFKKVQPKNPRNPKSTKNGKPKSEPMKTLKECIIHGKCAHSTEECTVVKKIREQGKTTETANKQKSYKQAIAFLSSHKDNDDIREAIVNIADKVKELTNNAYEYSLNALLEILDSGCSTIVSEKAQPDQEATQEVKIQGVGDNNVNGKQATYEGIPALQVPKGTLPGNITTLIGESTIIDMDSVMSLTKTKTESFVTLNDNQEITIGPRIGKFYSCPTESFRKIVTFDRKWKAMNEDDRDFTYAIATMGECEEVRELADRIEYALQVQSYHDEILEVHERLGHPGIQEMLKNHKLVPTTKVKAELGRSKQLKTWLKTRKPKIEPNVVASGDHVRPAEKLIATIRNRCNKCWDESAPKNLHGYNAYNVIDQLNNALLPSLRDLSCSDLVNNRTKHHLPPGLMAFYQPITVKPHEQTENKDIIQDGGTEWNYLMRIGENRVLARQQNTGYIGIVRNWTMNRNKLKETPSNSSQEKDKFITLNGKKICKICTKAYLPNRFDKHKCSPQNILTKEQKAATKLQSKRLDNTGPAPTNKVRVKAKNDKEAEENIREVYAMYINWHNKNNPTEQSRTNKWEKSVVMHNLIPKQELPTVTITQDEAALITTNRRTRAKIYPKECKALPTHLKEIKNQMQKGKVQIVISKGLLNPQSQLPAIMPPFAELSPVPNTMTQVLRHKHKDIFLLALQKEVAAMTHHGVFDMPDTSYGTLCRSRIIFEIKTNTDGSVQRVKARWVIDGRSQKDGIDFDSAKLYAPTVRQTTIRAYLALAAEHGMEAVVADAAEAYLHAFLDKSVHIKLPKGLSSVPSTRILKLIKAQYGTRQAGRMWFEHLITQLKQTGWIQSEVDPALFMRDDNGHKSIALVWTDDILFLTQKRVALQKSIDALGKRVMLKHTTDVGTTPVKYLGGEIVATPHGFKMTNKQKINDIMTDHKIVSKNQLTPLPNIKYHGDDAGEILPAKLAEEFGTLIGKIQFITTASHLTIGYATSFLSGFKKEPRENHFRGVIHLCQYLNSIKDEGISFKRTRGSREMKDCEIRLLSFSDASFADRKNGTSTTGMAHVLHFGQKRSYDKVMESIDNFDNIDNNGLPTKESEYKPVDFNLIFAKSKRQSLQAQSSYESELIAANDTSNYTTYFYDLLKEMGLFFGIQIATPNILIDNNAAIITARGTLQNWKRTKHMKLRYYNILHQVARKALNVQRVDTTENLADLWTKILGKVKIKHFFHSGKEYYFNSKTNKKYWTEAGLPDGWAYKLDLQGRKHYFNVYDSSPGTDDRQHRLVASYSKHGEEETPHNILLKQKLRAWRFRKKEDTGKKQYDILTNEAIQQIIESRPKTYEELRAISGITHNEDYCQELWDLYNRYAVVGEDVAAK
eukprot:g1206.t1